MACDKIEKLNNSLIQHGKQSNRIYLMKLDNRDLPVVIVEMDKLAEDNGYTKIFAKVPADKLGIFSKNGFNREAAIPGYYNGSKGCVFVVKYFSEDRKIDKNMQEITKIKNTSIRKCKEKGQVPVYYKYPLQKATPDDVVEISDLYNRVFDTYPFPIGNPNYIRETMESHISYYVMRDPRKIIAISSAEMDHDLQNAEMTDFATLPEHRGKNLSGCLLAYMESEMRTVGIKTAYTIARAMSYGINITFSKNNYHFAGTLINNTNISGQIESMNVWYKKIQ